MLGKVLESCTAGLRVRSASIRMSAACKRSLSVSMYENPLWRKLELDADVAQLGVELHGVNTALAPDAGLLRAAERRPEIAQEPGIHPGDADLDLRGDAMGTRQVLGPDRSRKAVRTVIGEREPDACPSRRRA